MLEFISNELMNMGYNYPTRIDKTLKSRRERIVGFSLKSAVVHHHHYEDEHDMNEKLDELRESLLDAHKCCLAGEVEKSVMELSYFHWQFTHIHPFTNINNSIAMNIANSYLKQMNIGFIPHLFLDYFAQRTGSKLYENIFSCYLGKYFFPLDRNTWKEKQKQSEEYYASFLRTGIHNPA